MCDELLQDLVNWTDSTFDQESEHFSSAEYVHQNPPSLDVGFGFRSPDESSSKRVKLSPFNQQEEGEIDASRESSLLGLKLNKSPSLISLLESKLSRGRRQPNNISTKLDSNGDDKNNISTKLDSNGGSKKPTSKLEDLVCQPMSEKLKASNVPAMLLKIGSWERISMHEGDLVAKCYYAKRKLVWEVLEGALKSKIEIQWSHIVGIRATISDDQPGTLEIELLQPPSFFRETNPQPRKHTLWQPASDFTGGQAPICRRHYVRFAHGLLDKHYEKLLQCDQRLLHLSQRPFPSQESPYFDVNAYGLSEFSLDFNGYGPQILTGLKYPYQSFPAVPSHVQNMRQATLPPLRIMNSNSPMPVNVNNFMLENQRTSFWSEGNHIQQSRPIATSVAHANLEFPSHIVNPMAYEGVRRKPNADMGLLNDIFNPMAYEGVRRKSNADMGLLNDIQNHLLDENDQMVCLSEENTMTTRMRSMHPLFDPEELMNPMKDQMIVQDNSTMPGCIVCSPEPMKWIPHDFDEGMATNTTTNNPPCSYALAAYPMNSISNEGRIFHSSY